MNPAQLKTMRETLGVTVEYASKRLNVNPRTIQRWETPQADTSSDGYTAYTDFLAALWEIALDQVNIILDKVEELDKQYGEPRVISLSRWVSDRQAFNAGECYPASVLNAFVGLSLAALEGEGYAVEVSFRPVEE